MDTSAPVSIVRISIAVLGTVFAHGATAEIVDATDPERLVSIIQDLGYRAKLDVDNAGDPLIVSSVGGTEFSIFFYGCKSGAACKSLLYKVGYDLSDGTMLDIVNDWNATSLFGRAYMDDENDPWLELPVNMAGGVSETNFEDTFDWWEIIVGRFESHIGF